MSTNPSPKGRASPLQPEVMPDMASQKRSQRETWFEDAILISIPASTLLDLLAKSSISAAIMAFTCVLFLWKYVHRSSVAVRRTSLVLLAVTALLLPIIESPLSSLEKGIRIGGLIASLLISVGLLSRASLRVPRMRKVVTDLFALPRGQRPLALGVASQFFGGFLGLAGLTMMMDVASTREGVDQIDQLADFNAISRGYAALSLWSPMYSNMSIVLALYEGLHWIDVLPYALAIGLVFIVLGVLLERLKQKNSGRNTLAKVSLMPLLRDGWLIVMVMLCFVVLMVLTSQQLKIPVSAVIIGGAPLVAWVLNVLYSEDQVRRLASGTITLKQDIRGQTFLAGEVMLFIASGCAGAVISQAIPVHWSAAVAQLALGSPYLGSLLLMASIVLLSGTSIHPMLSAVLIASTLTAPLLGLPPLVHLCGVLVGWGLAIIVTPFSVISITGARFSGIPILTLSLKANLSFVLWALAGAALTLGFASTHR